MKIANFESVAGPSSLLDISKSEISSLISHRLSLTQSPAFSEWFGESIIVDSLGRPEIKFHSTFSDFDSFKTDHGNKSWKRFGAHFGSLESANTRIEVKTMEDIYNRESSGNAGCNIVPVFLSVENPLRLSENRTGRWGVDDIMQCIMQCAEKGSLSLDQSLLDDYFDDQLKINGLLWVEEPPESKAKMLRSFLDHTLEVDAIVYSNSFEGGGDSYLLWHPSRIKSALGNSGEFCIHSLRINE